MDKKFAFSIRLCILCAFILICAVLYSQTFEKFYHTSLDDHTSDAIQLSNGNSVIVINRGDFFTQFSDFILLIIEPDGNIADSIIYSGSENYNFYGLSNLHNYNDSIIVGFRVCADEQLNSFLNIIKFDEEFNVLLDTIVGYEIPELYLFYDLFTIDYKLIVTATETVTNEVFLYEYELDSDKLNYHSIIDTGGFINQWPMIIADLPEKNVFHLYLFDVYKTIYEINKADFSVDTTYNYYPYNFQPRKAISSFDDSTYFVAGRESDLSNPDVRFIPSYFEISQNGNILNYQIYDLQNDTSSYFVSDCFVRTETRIYFALTYNYTSDPPFTIIPEPRWIWLMCLYPDGTLDWQRFYKGDVNYMPFELLPTSDGGLLIGSNRYDWNDPVPYQRDVHILKVDSTGWYEGLATGLPNDEAMNQILVYPNPASDYIKFVLGMYKNLKLDIYNSAGLLVYSDFLEQTKIIDVSHLPKGLYLYLLKGKNGFYEKGKLIKE
ncbi:MAG: T9SS type A sorting domain-containing protein [Bacteroidales bacterium]|nr:T9SS type A sorting domain-containing protein [Bacteroidales bacterium]MCF8403000.1 T9SS type A sorting domain-containing protein [Bacteroidales bacterium]